MQTPFRLVALAQETFAPLFTLSDEALVAQGIRRRVAGPDSGYPCRVSLTDTTAGESVLLLPYEHQPANGPYRSSGAIFVREAATRATPAVGEVPEAFRRRLLSVRAYDEAGIMLDSDVCEGVALEEAVERCFAQPEVAYLHLHNAKPGCYACRVDRA